LANRSSLFQALAEQLKLPIYFGRNWDALSDCLRDLSWIKPRRVVILHTDLPPFDEATLRSYLEVLAPCIKDWKVGEAHELIVVFPPQYRDRIKELLTKNKKKQ
jgi:RNAse (barnase) inhibitor barstar